MKPALVRSDATGIYIKTGGHIFRPGAMKGYGHYCRMDDGGIKPGSRVNAMHKGGTPLAKLRLDDGTITFWAEEYHLAQSGIMDLPADISWNDDGSRQIDKAPPLHSALPRIIPAITGADLTEIIVNRSNAALIK